LSRAGVHKNIVVIGGKNINFKKGGGEYGFPRKIQNPARRSKYLQKPIIFIRILENNDNIIN
jgi:hypothetical protein